jgi:hypothetical protein
LCATCLELLGGKLVDVRVGVIRDPEIRMMAGVFMPLLVSWLAENSTIKSVSLFTQALPVASPEIRQSRRSSTFRGPR